MGNRLTKGQGQVTATALPVERRQESPGGQRRRPAGGRRPQHQLSACASPSTDRIHVLAAERRTKRQGAARSPTARGSWFRRHCTCGGNRRCHRQPSHPLFMVRDRRYQVARVQEPKDPATVLERRRERVQVPCHVRVGHGWPDELSAHLNLLLILLEHLNMRFLS